MNGDEAIIEFLEPNQNKAVFAVLVMFFVFVPRAFNATTAGFNLFLLLSVPVSYFISCAVHHAHRKMK